MAMFEKKSDRTKNVQPEAMPSEAQSTAAQADISPSVPVAQDEMQPVSNAQSTTVQDVQLSSADPSVLTPGRELASSHNGLIGIIENTVYEAEKKGQHVIAAGLHHLMLRLGELHDHVKTLEKDISDEYAALLEQIKAMLFA